MISTPQTAHRRGTEHVYHNTSSPDVYYHVCDHLIVVETSNAPERVNKIQLGVVWGSLKINLDRDINEPLATVLKRLSLSLKKLQGKESVEKKQIGKKKRDGNGIDKDESSNDACQSRADTEISRFTVLESTQLRDSLLPKISGPDDIVLYRDDGSAISPKNISCGEGFCSANRVNISGQSLSIVRNPPKITKIGISGETVVGLPCVVSFDHFPPFYSVDEFVVEWYSPVSLLTPTSLVATHCNGRPSTTKPLNQYLIHVGRWYVPRPEDAGIELLVKGFHRSMPCLATEMYSMRVKPSNPKSWRHRRLSEFRKENLENLDNVFRVASFNLLADEYARTPVARELMFPYCASQALTITYRNPRLSAELLDLDCDLFGLQECSSRFYKQTLKPLLEQRYESRLTLKKSKVKEGIATFYDRRKFTEIERLDFDFKTTIISDSHFAPLISQIARKWPQFLTDVLPHLSTVFQITVFECQFSSTHPIVIFANTHLFYHAWAPHIRIIQIALMFHRIALIRSKYQNLTNQDVGVILVGDFNAPHQSGAYQLLSRGFVSDELEDWKFGTQFTWGLMKDSEENAAEEQVENEELLMTGNEQHTTSAFEHSSCVSHLATADISPEPITPISSTADSSPPLAPTSTDSLTIACINEVDSNRGFRISAPAELGKIRDAYESNQNSFTNIVNGFCATLDHILITDSMFAVSRLLSPITLEEGRQHGGLPSIDYPSDHISIAVELRFKTQNE